MAAVIVETAEAVVKAINAAALSLAITAERSYGNWDMAIEDLGAMRVDVVPNGAKSTAELSDRAHLEYGVPIDIAVRKRFGTNEQQPSTGEIANEEIDPLALLVEEIHKTLTPQRLADYTSAIWKDTKILAWFIPRHLKEMRQFTGILRVTFEVEKAL